MDLHQRTVQFREKYRSAMSPNYHGLLHGGFVFSVGLFFIGYCLLKINTLSWILVPAFLIATLIFNAGEYIAHRELGHKKRRFAKLFYARHSGDHHTFFSHEDYVIDNTRDLRVVLFPAPLLLAITFIFAAPLGYIVAAFVDADTGWCIAAALIFNYLLYEFIHLCNHLPERYSITRWPLLRQMREYHRLHHQPDYATRFNFNITYPIADRILRTRITK